MGAAPALVAALAGTPSRAADAAGLPATTLPFDTLAFAAAAAIFGLLVAALFAARAAAAHLRLREALRDARLRLRTVDELIDAGVWETDASHQLVSLRPPPGAPDAAWPAATTGIPVWDRFQADDGTALRARFARGAPLNDIAVRIETGTGTARCALLRGRARTDGAGRFAGYLGTVRETPATVPVAHAPMPLPTGAAAASPIAAPAPDPTAEAEHESFSFTVSHDLRAPIRVVEGFTKIVKEDYGRLLDRVGNDHLDRVLGAAARMNNMIDALLALSKLSSQPLATQPVNLSQLAGFVVDDLRREWPERRMAVEIADGMLVQGDPTLLRVVIENLLGNAWKYTGKADKPRIVFARHAENPGAFTISDNGAGFDMRFADRLFGVFQRLHSANDFPGTGVGLASVRRIVRRHGGDIWGEGEVNRGARFHFSLPQRETR